jgi:hypothetical protein
LTLADYPLLADANIHPGVVEYLRSKGLDVQTVAGHIRPAFTRETLDAIFRQQLLLTPPFILVARRAGDRVHLRIRRPIPE